jgi:Caudovirales tail fibre assembly protein, lambda gpK
MTMKKYARVVNGKVDNIFETVNPITEEFAPQQVWVDITGRDIYQVDYDYIATNYNGAWTFNSEFPWSLSELGKKLREEKAKRFDSVVANLAASDLQAKVDLGIATAAETAYLTALNEYFVAFMQVNKQPGYPQTITWPQLP